MQTPLRILRADCDYFDRTPRVLTERQRESHERIVGCATQLFAKYGRNSITFRSLAVGLRMAAPTLRFHFADLDSILAEILQRHLLALSQAIGAIPHDAEDRDKRRRAAYLAATRNGFGGFVPAHLLLVQERHTLPEDLRDIVDQTRRVIGENLAGGRGEEALLYLDAPFLDAVRIEANLAPQAQEADATVAPPGQPKRLERQRFTAPSKISDSKAIAGADEKPGDWIYGLARDAPARAPPKRDTGYDFSVEAR